MNATLKAARGTYLLRLDDVADLDGLGSKMLHLRDCGVCEEVLGHGGHKRHALVIDAMQRGKLAGLQLIPVVGWTVLADVPQAVPVISANHYPRPTPEAESIGTFQVPGPELVQWIDGFIRETTTRAFE